MRNSYISTALLFFFMISVFSVVVSDEFAFEQELRRRFIDSISIDYVPPSVPVFFENNDIEEYGAGYKKPTERFGKVLIDVPVVNQYPELPVGCEITSAAAYLNYIGIDIDKVTLQENYLPDSYNFVYFDDGRMRTGPDPNKVFVGLPEESGFGCFDTVIVNSLNKFFADNGYSYKAIRLENATQADLELLLDNGVPIEVWASINMMPFQYTDNNRWVLETTGEEFCWPKNSHALVLCGYDDKDYYFSDCNNKKGIVAYKKTDFLERWEEFGCQSVIITLGEENSEKSEENT